jgi:hypothetical protein
MCTGMGWQVQAVAPTKWGPYFCTLTYCGLVRVHSRILDASLIVLLLFVLCSIDPFISRIASVLFASRTLRVFLHALGGSLPRRVC